MVALIELHLPALLLTLAASKLASASLIGNLPKIREISLLQIRYVILRGGASVLRFLTCSLVVLSLQIK